MDLAEALDILGLDRDGTPDELDENFRKLATSLHPDKGGDESAMQRVNVAKDIVSAFFQSKSALVPADTIKEIVVATNKGLAAYEEKKETSKRAFTRVLDLETSRPKKMKRMAALFGGVSAGAIFLGKDIPEKYLASVGGGADIAGSMLFTALTIGIYAAIFWWYLDNKVKRIEHDIEDLDASLGDKVYYVDLLHQVFNDEIANAWDKEKIEHSIREWAEEKHHRHSSLSRLIRDAGAPEIAKLLIAKGIETEVLKKESKTVHMRISENYSLNI